MLRLASALLLCLALASSAHAQGFDDMGEENAGALGSPRPSAARLLILPVVGRGIDPVVAPHVMTRLVETAIDIGYEIVPAADAVNVLARLRLREAASPADLWRATFVAEARRGITTNVWAEQGRYVFEISVASLDGTGPFRARGDASADELLDRVRDELRRILAAPSEWNQAEAERIAQSAATPHPVSSSSAAQSAGLPPSDSDVPGWRRRQAPTRTDRPFSVAFQTESAIGTSGSGFYNHLIGARIDYHFNRNFSMGAYLGYVNLRGNSGRVSNLLPYLQLEHRVHVLGEDGLSVPIRAGFGFLPYNGFFMRISGGLNIPIGDRIELAADLLTPTFWFTPDGRVTSFDIALEVIYRFGERHSDTSSAR